MMSCMQPAQVHTLMVLGTVGWPASRCCLAHVSLSATAWLPLSAHTLPSGCELHHHPMRTSSCTPASRANSRFFTVYSWPHQTCKQSPLMPCIQSVQSALMYSPECPQAVCSACQPARCASAQACPQSTCSRQGSALPSLVTSSGLVLQQSSGSVLHAPAAAPYEQGVPGEDKPRASLLTSKAHVALGVAAHQRVTSEL